MNVIDALNDITRTVRADLLAQARRHLPDRLSTPRAQVAYLHKRAGGSTRTVAGQLGVHPETIRRYLKGLRKNPPDAFAARLAAAVRSTYRPRVSGKQVDEAMSTRGLRVHLTAAFGFSGTTGSSDDPRERQMHADLPSLATRSLLRARDAGDEDTARKIVAKGVADDYFQFYGSGMDVEINDLLYVGFEL
ncbi:helix-turn-helix domain-containing protein [Streptomyces xinghaiensis]|uniref:XRE family transcriptional regulator n=1 Tax=Streptomyces xinghaiensis TaxID=1038928 RepID=A0A3R7F862_9ACTN|nr:MULTISPECIES: helix-turn-helix domain-containing protein [Streptomyces]OFA48225.1 hypothetical protein BEN35_18950 [Streptomyces fradiae]PQM20708.1 DNA-binding protein [Streptomyces xinghaiensis]RKM92649.1 XRE family transcriptional regulator [Streptomyces xinghaiensis]RNC70618.1 XRE family transcriptional regulator [Streptomyces xinghaiensis]